jgi:hypothetical protein
VNGGQLPVDRGLWDLRSEMKHEAYPRWIKLAGLTEVDPKTVADACREAFGLGEFTWDGDTGEGFADDVGVVITAHSDPDELSLYGGPDNVNLAFVLLVKDPESDWEAPVAKLQSTVSDQFGFSIEKYFNQVIDFEAEGD